MRWSRYRGGSGESAILAFGVESARWLHPTSFVATGLCLAVLPRQRSAWLPWSVAVGKTDETLNGGPPLVELVFRRRVIQEQLSSR